MWRRIYNNYRNLVGDRLISQGGPGFSVTRVPGKAFRFSRESLGVQDI